jgi:hypothetical protein
MWFAVIITAFLPAQPSVAAAQQSVAVTSASITASRALPSRIDPRWGVLAEIAEGDFHRDNHLVTVRWDVPGKRIVWTRWKTWLGVSSSSITFELDEVTGLINWWPDDRSPQQPLVVRADGELFGARDSTRVAWREPGGQFVVLGAGRLRPLTPGNNATELATLVRSGRVRAADASLTARAASATVALPVQSSPPTRVSSAEPANVPAAPLAPAAAAAPTPGGPRYALVIGNEQYDASHGRLTNPVNDAQSVAAALQAVGFTVDLVVDADQKTMKRAISRFGDRLAAGGRSATGLFYYAGHGIQSRGTNYLIPVAAPIEREADLDLEGVAADTVLAQMEEAGAGTSIVILDACRNMPLARSFRSASRGLARMDAPNGSFIAYSTAPGATAADGDGRNSPFAAALVRQLGQKGLPIEVMFRGIRRQVVEATRGQQTPWDSSSLLDPFYFVP